MPGSEELWRRFGAKKVPKIVSFRPIPVPRHSKKGFSFVWEQCHPPTSGAINIARGPKMNFGNWKATSDIRLRPTQSIRGRGVINWHTDEWSKKMYSRNRTWDLLREHVCGPNYQPETKHSARLTLHSGTLRKVKNSAQTLSAPRPVCSVMAEKNI